MRFSRTSFCMEQNAGMAVDSLSMRFLKGEIFGLLGKPDLITVSERLVMSVCNAWDHWR